MNEIASAASSFWASRFSNDKTVLLTIQLGMFGLMQITSFSAVI